MDNTTSSRTCAAQLGLHFVIYELQLRSAIDRRPTSLDQREWSGRFCPGRREKELPEMHHLKYVHESHILHILDEYILSSCEVRQRGNYWDISNLGKVRD
jgi:hypothetical protein